jgi:hypothetical protein
MAEFKFTIIGIEASAGRTFNHPYEMYSNFRQSVTLRAVIQEGDNHTEAAKELQKQAEALADERKTATLAYLKGEHDEKMNRYYFNDPCLGEENGEEQQLP